MKYKVGDKTLLGEIVTASMGSFPYLVDGRWRFTESEIDKIIIKPKRNIDHVIELWDEGKRKDAVNYFYNCARFSSAWEDIAILGEVYIEPSKDPKLTPEEIKALKLARDCGFNWIYKNIQGNIMLQEYSCGGRSMFAWCAPAFSTILTLENMNEEPMSINELLKDEV